jgi:hypothetical protein
VQPAEAGSEEAKTPPPREDPGSRRPDRPAAGAWAEWTIRLRPGVFLFRTATEEPTPAGGAEEAAEANLRLRLEVVEQRDDALRMIAWVVRNGQPPQRTHLTGDPVALWRSMKVGTLPGRMLEKKDVLVEVDGQQVACSFERYALIMPHGGERTVERWTAPEVRLGPLRLRTEGVAIDLVAFGRGGPPGAPPPYAPDGQEGSAEIGGGRAGATTN